MLYLLYVRAIGRAIRLHRLAVVQQLVHQHHLMGRLRGRVAELGARDVGPGDLHAAWRTTEELSKRCWIEVLAAFITLTAAIYIQIYAVGK